MGDMSCIGCHSGEGVRVVADDRAAGFEPEQVIDDMRCNVGTSVAHTSTHAAREALTAKRVGAALVIVIAPMSLLGACDASSIAMPPCSLVRSAETSDNPLQEQLGCGPVFHFNNGANGGFRGGEGSFCPDLPDTRAVLHDHQRYGFDSNLSDACMILPEEEIFVFWTRDPMPAPTCTSGCLPGYEPVPF
jgi:hypothetical protein